MASATLAISSSVCRLTQKQSSFPLSLSKNSFISLSTPPPSSPLFSQRLDFRPVISNRPAFPRIPKFSESVVPVVESDSPVIESEPEPVSEAAQLVQATASVPKREEIFAVVMVGSRQYIVFPGRWIYTQRLKGANVNDKVVLNKVLLVGTKTAAYIGKPVVTNAAVHAVVEEQLLDKKVIVFKYKKKKNYRRNIGHRQDGRIDYGEFAAMMRKGDAGIGGRTMRGNLNFNLTDALGVNASAPAATTATTSDTVSNAI